MNKVNILYDEQGTPTFADKRETNYFVGVAIAYQSSSENNLFEKCDALFGLSRSKPMKNDKISNSRAIKIAELLSNLNLIINFFYLDLNSEKLYSTVKLYEDFGNIFREKYRGVRKRTVAQILYGEVLSHTLFSIISNYIKVHQVSTLFSSYADNWSYPNCDVELSLNNASQSIALKNNEINDQFFPGVRVSCNNIQLLVEDSKKKRFIDVLASVISRNFLNSNNSKYSDSVLNTMFSDDSYDILRQDITEVTIDTLNYIMDDISRNG